MSKAMKRKTLPRQADDFASKWYVGQEWIIAHNAFLTGYRACQADARRKAKRTQSTGHYGPKVGL